MKKPMVVIGTLLRVATAVSLVSWGDLQLRRWDWRVEARLPQWSRVPGVLFMICGGGVVLLCGGILSTREIFEMPGERWLPKEFVASGPFRYVRNPMSLGWVVFMLGLGMYESSVMMIGFAVGLFFFLHLIVVLVEEPGLEKRFGESYREYKRAVRRWVPKFVGQGAN